MSRHGTAKSVITKGPLRRGDGGRGIVTALIRGDLPGCRDRVPCRTGRAGGNDRVDPAGVSRGRSTGGESIEAGKGRTPDEEEHSWLMGRTMTAANPRCGPTPR